MSCSSKWLQQLQDAEAQPAAQRKAASGGRVHPDCERRDKLVGGQFRGPHCTWWVAEHCALLPVLNLVAIARSWIRHSPVLGDDMCMTLHMCMTLQATSW
jgi:hypothetical protein